ncbi:nucleic acid-binding protein, partial [Aureobasidium melanogenum]
MSTAAGPGASQPRLKTEMMNPATTTKSTSLWNTQNLGLRLCADVASAATAAALVAPVITAIDKAIIENASGRQTLGRSLRDSLATFALRPHHFLFSKPFALIFMLYGGTYITANTLDTCASTIKGKSASTTTSGPAKFLATSSANLSLCLYKDSRFAKLFGVATSSPRHIPGPSYALFAVRDCLTVFASFNVPPLIAPLLPLSEGMQKHVSAASAAQFLAPAAVQLISTPLHLLGLDLYNRDGTLGAKDRWARVRRDWLKTRLSPLYRYTPRLQSITSTTHVRNMATLDDKSRALLQKAYPQTPELEGDMIKLSQSLFPKAEYSTNEKTEIEQWLITSSHIASSTEDAAKTAERLSSLNTHLSTRTTLLGSKPSVADIALYARVAPVIASWSDEQRTGEQGYHHIVRHADFVQNSPLFGLKVEDSEKVKIDQDNIIFKIKPIDLKAEKERKKKEKELAAQGATSAANAGATVTSAAAPEAQQKSVADKATEQAEKVKDQAKS